MTDPDASTDSTAPDEHDPGPPRLSPIEARILACLVEKEATTPDQYPLTENALTLACNQKTSRDPVMNLSTGEVGHTLRRLEDRQLVRSQHASRAQRWGHRFAAAWDVTTQQQAVLCVLLLRGPQTLNEILTRSERIARFADADELQHTLERLAGREPALVLKLPRAPGQREERWAQLLTGPVDLEAFAAASAAAAQPGARGLDMTALSARVEALEQRVAALEASLPAPPMD